MTGADSASGEVRTFQLDMIHSMTTLPGTFQTPAGFDRAVRVLPGLAKVRELPAGQDTGWVRVLSRRAAALTTEFRRDVRCIRVIAKFRPIQNRHL